MEYLYPCVPELKIKDYYTYQAFCCGLCSQLGNQYGVFARYYCRNHDLVLFALLTDSLAGRDATVCHARCPGNLLHKQDMMCHTQGIRVAARLNVLLTWYWLRDMRRGPLISALRSRLAMLLLSGAHRRVVAEEPVLERLILQEIDHAAALELADCSSYEAAAEPSGNVFAALFAYCAPDAGAGKALRRAGRALGRIFYLLGQMRSYPQDKKKKRFNIFLQNGLSYEAARENAQYQCNQAAAELARAYNMLDVKLNRPLLENILFQGLEESVTQMGQIKAHKWKRPIPIQKK